MKYLKALTATLAFLAFVACNKPATAQAEDYKQTDLPFQAQISLSRGGGFSESVGADGKIKTTASGVKIASLSLGGKDIPLQSNDVTADAMIVTKDYGKLLVKMNQATFSCTVLVTPTQEAALRKFLSTGTVATSPAQLATDLASSVAATNVVVAVSGAIENSVVKIFSTVRYPDPYQPWTKQSPEDITGSGVVIEGKRILTNAHVVNYASQVQIQANQAGDKISATVEAIAPGIDLAVLKLDDETFFDTHPPLARAKSLPGIKDVVMAYGYPGRRQQSFDHQGHRFARGVHPV